jgi:hypothetical protein
VCGFRSIETSDQANAAKFPIGTIVYTVEFDDGESAQIPEDALDIVH